MKKFGTLGHSFCLCYERISRQTGARRFSAVGATTAQIRLFKERRLVRLCRLKKGQFFNRLGREKFNYQYLAAILTAFAAAIRKNFQSFEYFRKIYEQPNNK
jgi:hypothetical protein